MLQNNNKKSHDQGPQVENLWIRGFQTMPFNIRFTRTSWLSHYIVIFLLNESKTSAVLEPRTGHFQGLVGFEVKAKTSKFQEHPQGLHTWNQDYSELYVDTNFAVFFCFV